MVRAGNFSALTESSLFQGCLKMANVKIWRDDCVNYIDVRGMEPPVPFVEILKLLEDPDCTDEVIVYHHRDPVYLFPELQERDWAWEYLCSEPGDIRLKLTREKK